MADLGEFQTPSCCVPPTCFNSHRGLDSLVRVDNGTYHASFRKYADVRCNLSEQHIMIGESGITIDGPGLAAHRVLSVFGGENKSTTSTLKTKGVKWNFLQG